MSKHFASPISHGQLTLNRSPRLSEELANEQTAYFALLK